MKCYNHDNLKPRSPASRRRTAATCTSPRRPTSKARTTSSALFRSTAEGETGHAHGHLDYLAGGRPGDRPADRRTRENLKAAVAGETHEYTDMYPGMAKQARDEGFDEIADWFETLAKAERSHANRFQKALDNSRIRFPIECGKDRSRLRPGIRSTGKARSSGTRRRPRRSSSASSTSATAAGAASAFALRSHAVRPGRRIADDGARRRKKEDYSKSSTSATSATCAT